MSIGNSPEDERPFEDVSEEARPSVGHALRRARIAAGLTVDDVSSATRVRIAIVHAIESDDFAPCGGDVYARGHIRTLAKAVHLDPAPLIAQYESEHGGGRPAPTPAAPLFEAERIRPERRGPNWTAAMVAAIVVVIGFVGFTMVNGGDDGDNANVAEGTEPTTSPSPTPTTKKPADPAPDPSDSAIAAAPQDKVTVRVTAADGRSWISAKDHNGRLLFDGLLKQGDSKTFQDSFKVNLVLGDAGAIDLFVNGKKIEDDWQPGAVERLTYTKGDPQAG
ncbi:helix-turn-helix domain-containing protein [Streptomyces capillispiralis]|uniref:Cytoskeletal protein RodZ n=1 Tax=Streptomyces capillispiralis TaxID=68182 RepID=A0A561TCJ2_9ACTN|nr:helix-turn-helix domain-containing protein [Streptomyces capillispiralis]TWF84835.1 cytoskeletal protein RodZ [Streptomyces capillispiralis]GHH96060.1 membrane protein [Streptomyces capillispiralis]